MENSDVFGSSTVPPTWHDFLNRMRQPSAADFVKAIKSFIVSLLNKPPDPERDSAAVQEFFSNMEAAFKSHPLWAGCSIEEMESAGEGLEKYVMTKLFTHVFASIPDDVKVDDQLHEKIALLQQFIWPDNLDIRTIYQNETSWLLAQKELQKINMYKAPRDKLNCILNCCKVINNLLLNASISSNENPPGADDFLPVLIYITIKANPPQLHSNLSYIQRYRCQSRLVSEAAYFLTNMVSAETFILNSDAKALSMDEAEFENNMESAKALLSDLLANSDDMSSQGDQNVGHVPRTESKDFKQQVLTSKHQSSATRPRLTPNSSETNFGNEEIYMKDHLPMKQQLLNSKNQNLAMWPQLTPTSSETNIGNEEVYRRDQSSMNKVPSISDLENRGVTLLMKEDTVSQFFRDFPFLYSRAGDLRVKDVEDLLNSYKQLVFKYVCLSKGLGVATTSSKLSILQSETESQGEPKYCETEGLTETHEDNVRTDDESNVASPVGEELSESELLQSEVVTSQSKALDAISQT